MFGNRRAHVGYSLSSVHSAEFANKERSGLAKTSYLSGEENFSSMLRRGSHGSDVGSLPFRRRSSRRCVFSGPSLPLHAVSHISRRVLQVN